MKTRKRARKEWRQYKRLLDRAAEAYERCQKYATEWPEKGLFLW